MAGIESVTWPIDRDTDDDPHVALQLSVIDSDVLGDHDDIPSGDHLGTTCSTPCIATCTFEPAWNVRGVIDVRESRTRRPGSQGVRGSNPLSSTLPHQRKHSAEVINTDPIAGATRTAAGTVPADRQRARGRRGVRPLGQVPAPLVGSICTRVLGVNSTATGMP
ncbi:hypothetical protein GCM10017691_08070 [Pseudonocardia petroleophila]